VLTAAGEGDQAVIDLAELGITSQRLSR